MSVTSKQSGTVNVHVVVELISSASDRRGGFPTNKFCNKEKSEFYRCLLCFDVCRAPVTCHSGAHLFCFDCLSKSLQNHLSCPVCQEPLVSPVPSAFAAAQVSALEVVCIYDQCKWRGTCGQLDNHLDIDCLHEPVRCSDNSCTAFVLRGEMTTHQQFACLQSCPNSKSHANSVDITCEVCLSRHDLVDHLSHDCKLRIIHCPHPHCDVSTVHSQMPAHVEVCPYAHVLCPRECGAQTLVRQSLNAHKKECSKEPVACVHAPLGCSHVAPRNEIVLHEQDIALHFSAVRSKAFAEQQQFYQQQISEMKQMFEQKLHIFETKLEEHLMLFNWRQEEQSALMEERLERQMTAFNELQQAQLSLLKKNIEEIKFSHQLLLNKAEAEAKAAKAAAFAEARSKEAGGYAEIFRRKC